MKINDLISVKQIDEDNSWERIGKGIGAGAGLLARGFGYDPETAQANRLDSNAKKIGLKMFTKQLTDLLTHAKKSGMLTPPTTSGTTYTRRANNPNSPAAVTNTTTHAASIDNPNIASEKPYVGSTDPRVNRADQIALAYKAAIAKPEASWSPEDKKAIRLGKALIASRNQPRQTSVAVQTGQTTHPDQTTQTAEEFISQFLATQTGKFKDYPTYSSNLKILAKQAAKEFNLTGKISSETMSNMWENLWMWSKMSGGGSHSRTQSRSSNGQASDEETTSTEKKMTPEEIKREFIKNSKRVKQKINSRDLKDSIIKLILLFDGQLNEIDTITPMDINDPEKISQKFEELANLMSTIDMDSSSDKEKVYKNLYSIAGAIGL